MPNRSYTSPNTSARHHVARARAPRARCDRRSRVTRRHSRSARTRSSAKSSAWTDVTTSTAPSGSGMAEKSASMNSTSGTSRRAISSIPAAASRPMIRRPSPRARAAAVPVPVPTSRTVSAGAQAGPTHDLGGHRSKGRGHGGGVVVRAGREAGRAAGTLERHARWRSTNRSMRSMASTISSYAVA